MKKGQVFINPYASDRNPLKKGVYIGNNKAMTLDFEHIFYVDIQLQKECEKIGFALIQIVNGDKK